MKKPLVTLQRTILPLRSGRYSVQCTAHPDCSFYRTAASPLEAAHAHNQHLAGRSK